MVSSLDISLDTNGENNDFYTVCNRKHWITPPSHKIEIPDAMGARSNVNNMRLCMNIIHIVNMNNRSFGCALGRNSEIIRTRRAPSCRPM